MFEAQRLDKAQHIMDKSIKVDLAHYYYHTTK